MWKRLTLCLLGSAGPALAESPIADVICAPRDTMVQRLMRQHRATLQGYGLRDIETVMEVWASPGGDWTLVQNRMDGQSCIVAMGADWAVLVPQTPAEG